MPEAQQVHIDAALTNVSVAYRNNDYIAELIAPRVPVRKQSDRYFIYDAEREAIRLTQDLRAPGSLADEIDYTLSTDSYFCQDHALASAVADEERENADPVIQPDIDRTEFLTERILLKQESIVEEMLRTNSDILERTPGPGEEWNVDTSDPVADVQQARLDVFAQCQRRANVMVLPFQIYEIVRNHPAIVDRIKYTSHGVITTDLLAQVFDVDRVLVPRVFVNNAAKGQTPDIEELWKMNVYLLHVAERPGLKQMTVANTFVWNAMPGTVDGLVVERWRDHGRKADMIRVQKYYDTKIIAAGAAFRLGNVLG